MTQQDKILKKMLSYPSQRWWVPQNFMESSQYFVGYEASARLSELAKQYPELIESERQGKYLARRICFEKVNWIELLPENIFIWWKSQVIERKDYI